jgi:hypothetical protein
MPCLESEHELEMYLFNDDSDDHPIGLSGKVFRQVNLPGYGIADLIAVDFDWFCGDVTCNIKLVELKKGAIDLVAIAQIARYRQALEDICDYHASKRRGYKIHFHYNIRGVLVGEKLAHGDVCYLIDSVPWLELYTFDLSLASGIEFTEQSGWFRTDRRLDCPELVDLIKDDMKLAYRVCRSESYSYRKRHKRNLRPIEDNTEDGTP